VFDGELVVLDDASRPLFNELFGRGRPTYMAFDILMTDGEDLRSLPLRQRKAALARIGKRAESWIATAWSATGGRCTGPWSKPALRALSRSGSPMPATRSISA
jgi:ATP-dependent DNA ligase